MSKKLVDYTIVNASSIDKLAKFVNEFIKTGHWEVQGGVAIKVVTGSNISFYQAMVAYEDQ